jgi:hypothetical protein
VIVDLNSFLAALNMRPYLARSVDESTATTPPTAIVFANFSSSLRARNTKVGGFAFAVTLPR